MDVGDPVERVPLARGVRVPAIAGQELEVHRDRTALRRRRRRVGRGGRLVLRQIGRDVEELGPELILGLAGVDKDVVGPLVSTRVGELVRAGRGGRRAGGSGIDPSRVLDGLAVLHLIDAYIGRNVAVDEIEGEEHEFGVSDVKST